MAIRRHTGDGTDNLDQGRGLRHHRQGALKNHGFESTEIALKGKPVYQKGSLLLATIDTEIISPPDLDTYFNPQAYIFLSRH